MHRFMQLIFSRELSEQTYHLFLPYYNRHIYVIMHNFMVTA